MAKAKLKNNASSLLTREHNEQIFGLLGHRCVSLATTVVHLRILCSERYLTWIKKDEDVLCLVKDYKHKNFYFRLYSLKRNCMIWEKSLTKIEYVGLPNIFYYSQSKDFTINFTFKKYEETKEMNDIVINKLLRRSVRHSNKKLMKNAMDQQNLIIASDFNQSINDSKAVKNVDQQTLNDDTNTNQPTISRLLEKISSKSKPKSISKLDISAPIAVQRLGSVIWNPNHGFSTQSELPHSLKYLMDLYANNMESPQSGENVMPNFIEELGGPEEFEGFDQLSESISCYLSPYYDANKDWPMRKRYTDEETKEFIMDLIAAHSDSEKSVEEKARRKPLPPPLPPPRPPKPKTPFLPLPSNELNNDSSASPSLQASNSTLDVIADSFETPDDSSSDCDTVVDYTGVTLDSNADNGDLRKFLSAALSKRHKALYSDDSGEA